MYICIGRLLQDSTRKMVEYKSNVSVIYDTTWCVYSLCFLLASLDTVIASLSGAVEAAAERDGKGVRPTG